MPIARLPFGEDQSINAERPKTIVRFEEQDRPKTYLSNTSPLNKYEGFRDNNNTINDKPNYEYKQAPIQDTNPRNEIREEPPKFPKYEQPVYSKFENYNNFQKFTEPPSNQISTDNKPQDWRLQSRDTYKDYRKPDSASNFDRSFKPLDQDLRTQTNFSHNYSQGPSKTVVNSPSYNSYETTIKKASMLPPFQPSQYI